MCFQKSSDLHSIQEEYSYTIPPGHYTVLCLCIQFPFVTEISCREVAEEEKEGSKTGNKKKALLLQKKG